MCGEEQLIQQPLALILLQCRAVGCSVMLRQSERSVWV